jgi:hypothetical protein
MPPGCGIAFALRQDSRARDFLSMSFISIFGCTMDRHAPVRRDVAWDGKHYAGNCRHCGAPIIRIGHRKWRRRED